MQTGTSKGGKAKGLTGEWSRKTKKARFNGKKARAKAKAGVRDARGSSFESARGVGNLDFDPTE